MTDIPIDRLFPIIKLFGLNLLKNYQLTITPANPPFSFTDSVSWSTFTGFGSGGGGGSGDITVYWWKWFKGGGFSGKCYFTNRTR